MGDMTHSTNIVPNIKDVEEDGKMQNLTKIATIPFYITAKKKKNPNSPRGPQNYICERF